MSMLEKVANAISKRRAEEAGGCYSDGAENCDGERGNCRCMDDAIVDAKAAIEALREPSDRMGAQGLRANMGKGRAHCLSEDEMEAVGWNDHLAGNPSKWMKPTWRAMINAALEDRGHLSGLCL